MKRFVISGAGVVLVAVLLFQVQAPLRAGDKLGYKQTNCLKIGERKCMRSGRDCATSYPCKRVRKIQ